MPTAPIPPGTGPISPRPAQPGRAPAPSNEVKASGRNLRVDGDRNQTQPLPTAPGQAQDVDVEGVDLTTAAYALTEADRLIRRAPDASVGRVGKVGAAAALMLEGKELIQAMRESPMQMDRIVTALAGIAVNLGEFAGDTGLLAGVGGVGNSIQGLMATIDAVKQMKADGANPSNILQVLSGAAQTLGGITATLGLAFPALLPISTAFYVAAGALYLGQVAYDNRDWIADKAKSVWGAITDGASSLFQRATGSAPEPAAARPSP